jgi:antitoxin component of RelBE/YafQ-DinJ toxin-antitoxin module
MKMRNKTSKITLRLSEQEKELYKTLAEKYGISVSALIRLAMREFIERRREKHELQRD